MPGSALASLWSFACNAAMAGLAGFLAVDMVAPPQHLPWTPLEIDRPVGAATPIKIARFQPVPQPSLADAEFERCLAVLEQAGVQVERVDPREEQGFCVIRNGVRITGGTTPLSPGGQPMACPLAIRYAIWDRQALQPAAREVLGAEVERVEVAGTYACRTVGNATGPEARVSEHARANALDVFSIRLGDGRTISVASDWGAIDPNSRAARAAEQAILEAGGTPVRAEAPPEPGPEGRFLRRIRDEGCRIFGTVLSPEYNAAHRDHLHLDGSTFSLCQ
ncbi:extensin family protein [Brevundimonas sp. 2R-24]|uniref:Extensin family protein n=1 Tax=Peiella sedimenti TaxID=3061083 RepID=A0ABT8SMK5_9CAUL|nr:extensin family protein [Caulobacteraceae bacterium XZ-24]